MQDPWHNRASAMPHTSSFLGFLQQHPHQQPFPSPAATSLGLSSSSSVVASDGPPCQETLASSDSSGSVLKEHDYIGLAEVSSVSAEGSQEVLSTGLNLEETDLRLGLGPVKESSAPSKIAPPRQDTQAPLELKKGELSEAADVDSRKEVVWPERSYGIRSSQEMNKSEWSVCDSQRDRQAASDLQQRTGVQESRYGATEQRSLQNIWQAPMVRSTEGARVSLVSMPGQEFDGSRPLVLNALAGGRAMIPPAKNGIKRIYSETMAEPARLNGGESRPGAAMVVRSGLQESELMALHHQQPALLSNWAASKPALPASWHVGLEQSANSYGCLPSSTKPAAMAAIRVEKPVDNQESALSDAPPPKGQVVGWPPIRSYRKITLAAQPKPAGEEGDGPIFVKVNMDGITIGRKVDLNAHTCYESLLLALEEMFQPSAQAASQATTARDTLTNDAKHLRLLNGSEYVLTYEDKDGDWMLVGDVPWGMFVKTVRRLRITRGSEATGLVPRGSGKAKGHA